MGEKGSSNVYVKYEDESWKEEDADLQYEEDYTPYPDPSLIDADPPLDKIQPKRRKDRKIRTTVTK